MTDDVKDDPGGKESLPRPKTQNNTGPCLRCIWRTVLFRGSCLVALLLLLRYSFKFLWWNLQTETLSRDPIGRYGYSHRMQKSESETWMLSVPSVEGAVNTSKSFSWNPHLTGSDNDLKDAKSMLAMFQHELQILPPASEPIFSAGSSHSQQATLELTSAEYPSAWVDVYYPYYDTPVEQSLQIIDVNGSTIWNADLLEDESALDRHRDAHRYREPIPTWHSFSWSGEARGQLIYGNYGTQEDYQQLLTSGANLTGNIVVLRYGKIYTGLKVKRAEELGATGVLIYSDPQDDGHVTVENGFVAYPYGPARNPTSVRRDTSMLWSTYPGDPTTPGYPAYETAERKEPTNLPRIPSLPLSWQNAEKLLKEIDQPYLDRKNGDKQPLLSGQPSRKSIKLVNRLEGKARPIWNTMASIPGHIRDEVVVIGCSRDVTGGLVSFREVIRSFGVLLRKGWRPLRTVVFASWDAGEHGLLGSVEYGEDFAPWITEHVIAYINIDASSAGSQWSAASSPSLAMLMKQTALDVPHPAGDGRTLWDAQFDEGSFYMNSSLFVTLTRESEDSVTKSTTNIGISASGSNFAVFLQRLGVPSTSQGFVRAQTDAVHHSSSIYDRVQWQETNVDVEPDFSRQLAVAKHAGVLSLRIIDSIALPFNTTHYALELGQYLRTTEKAALTSGVTLAPTFSALREAITTLQFATTVLDAEKDIAETYLQELLDNMPKFPNRRPVCQRRSAIYEVMANFVKGIFGVPPHYQSQEGYFWKVYPETDETVASDHKAPFSVREFIKAAKHIRRVNRKLISFERGFISEDGIKDREWYRHLGVAPHKWLENDIEIFPGLTEAIMVEKSQSRAEFEANRLAELFSKLSESLNPIQSRIRYCRW